jgi:hypothetical protein
MKPKITPIIHKGEPIQLPFMGTKILRPKYQNIFLQQSHFINHPALSTGVWKQEHSSGILENRWSCLGGTIDKTLLVSRL